jgi:hypothetical protein
MSDEKAERVMQKVYYLDTVLFVPHYSKPHWWVCAGGMERTTAWLNERYATKEDLYLWPRHWNMS